MKERHKFHLFQEEDSKIPIVDFSRSGGWTTWVVSAAELIGMILFIVFVIWEVYVYTALILGTLPDYLIPVEKWYDILLGWVLLSL